MSTLTHPAPIALIGLDCASPKLLFGPLCDAMPSFSRLRARGRFGTLRSSTPPITLPAWACMLSGRDPGELGIYGFRERAAGSYGMQLVSSAHLREPLLFERLGRAGLRTASLFVPPSYPLPPVVHPEREVCVSCLLTPDASFPHTFPPELGTEIAERTGPYVPDVEGFRTSAPLEVIANLERMTAQHFAIARHVAQSRKPDFLAMVEIGLDRLHHVAWRSLDTSDPRSDPDPTLRAAAIGYLRALDRELASLLDVLGPEATVLVASDHGARPLLGAIAINEWLIERGYLVLAEPPPAEPTPLSALAVDWPRTRAWAEGGYYARIFLNARGREPEGAIAPEALQAERDALRSALSELRGPSGEALGHRIATPAELYRKARGTPPDLLVFLGDLDYRAAGTVGHGRVHLPGNDTGADACNHDWDGLFVLAGPEVQANAEPEAWSIYDVHETLLALCGMPREPEQSEPLGRSRAR